jgi:hypothetical protein
VAFELELIPTNSGSNTKKYKEMNRRISINTIGYAVPQSFITKGKQRLKQFTNTVYLKNGDEFEIELFNPTQNKVLAKIELNGKSIGSGIILRPGERVFLERYLDEAKKFLFETYVVNGNNEEVQQAIANNGQVKVSFHNEMVLSGTVTYTNPLILNGSINPYTYTTHNTLGGSTFTTTSTGTFNTSNVTYTSGVSNNVFYNQSFDTNSTLLKKPTSPLRHIETGRVEKGSDSEQTFTYDNSQFYSYASTTDIWEIKPSSTKPVVREELVTYCTECGAKRKKDTHKFCPHCGTKF